LLATALITNFEAVANGAMNFMVNFFHLCSVADPGSGAFLTRDPGFVKSKDPGSGMNNLAHIS
jgi:hypothetical protein